jgi:hypothetical protein
MMMRVAMMIRARKDEESETMMIMMMMTTLVDLMQSDAVELESGKNISVQD